MTNANETTTATKTMVFSTTTSKAGLHAPTCSVARSAHVQLNSGADYDHKPVAERRGPRGGNRSLVAEHFHDQASEDAAVADLKSRGIPVKAHNCLTGCR